MTAAGRSLYTTSAQSLHGPDRVEIDGLEQHHLSVKAPPALDAHDGSAWNPEQLYAAAVASCLHQTLGVVGSETGADLADSSVTAEVTLEHDGSLRYAFTTKVTLDLPHLDADLRRTVVEEAMRACPLARQVELADA